MSYAFATHWYLFTDRAEIYENVYSYFYPNDTKTYSDSPYNTPALVDSIIDAYPAANAQLGYDFNNADTNTVRAYGDLIAKGSTATASQVMIVLGIIESGLALGMITSPILKLTGTSNLHTDNVLDKVENVIKKVATGTGNIIENVGTGIVNTSDAFKNLPVILGVAAIAYYFLMVAPKSKKG
jgi:hypothetical protein